jgi:hypothetical protein
VAGDIPGLASGLQRAARAIVQDALGRGVGAAMPTNLEYQERYGISAGTMQRALAMLADHGALEVYSRGQLGRFIRTVDVALCWQAGSLDPVRLLMPPAGPPEADTLAEYLAEGLTARGIPHTVHHLPGGTARLAAVRDGSEDLTVVSSGTWTSDQAAHPGDGAVLLRELDAGSYYAPGRLVVVRRRDDRRTEGLRVAIDEDSPDHAALTRATLDHGHRYVPTSFPDVPRAVLGERVDAGVWHIARSVVPLGLAGLRLDALPPGPATELARSLSAAALVGTAARPELRLAINELPLDGLAGTQAEAIAQSDD